MKMRNYIKQHKRVSIESLISELEAPVTSAETLSVNKNGRRRFFCLLVSLLVGVPIVLALVAHREFNSISLSDEDAVKLSVAPIAAAAGKKSVITIPTGMVKANPFVPYRDIDKEGDVADVPTYSLVEPPEMLNENSDAARVMDTIVSGILYDKFSPSAILNIEGNDYLVKKGDVVNNYKVLSILPDSVTVQLGSNTYKAGIGEILTEGTLNHNDVSNLNNKFGGERQ